MDRTKLKLLTLFTCVLLLAAFSIPLMQNNMSTPVIPNTILSQIATTAPKGGSIEWQVDINNAIGRSIAVTANESYFFVGGANITDATTLEVKPMLWKFNNTGELIWNITLDITGLIPSDTGCFSKVALSPDNSSVYAVMNNFGAPILVKFDASNGNYIWNYTHSGGLLDSFYSVKVSLDNNIVYIAGSNTSLISPPYPTMFYVYAIDASSGTLAPSWTENPYKIFLNGTYDISLADDLALSPSGDTLYVSGYYSVYNGTKAVKLVALDASDGSYLWNVTSGAGGKFSAIDISSDGKKIYAIEDIMMKTENPIYYAPLWPAEYKNLIIINASDGNVTEKLPLSLKPYVSLGPDYGFSGALSLPLNESKLYALANYIPIFMGYYPTLMVQLDFGGKVTGALLTPDSTMLSRDLAPANDNESVYVVGYQINYVSTYPGVSISMFLLKGSPGPIPISPALIFLLLFTTLLQFQSSAAQRTNTYILAGVGVAVVAIVAVSLILVKIYGGK